MEIKIQRKSLTIDMVAFVKSNNGKHLLKCHHRSLLVYFEDIQYLTCTSNRFIQFCVFDVLKESALCCTQFESG